MVASELHGKNIAVLASIEQVSDKQIGNNYGVLRHYHHVLNSLGINAEIVVFLIISGTTELR